MDNSIRRVTAGLEPDDGIRLSANQIVPMSQDAVETLNRLPQKELKAASH